jgi:hypothetical protein
MESGEKSITGDKEKIFSELVRTLEAEFASEGYYFTLERRGATSSYTLEVQGTDGWDESFQEKFGAILDKSGFFKIYRFRGGKTCEFIIDQKMVEGRINWRAWFNTPEGIPESTQKTLDAIAGLPEIAEVAARREDTLGQISSFLSLALDIGVIKPAEYRELYSDVQTKGNLR